MRIVYALPGIGFGGAQLSDFQRAADLRRRGHRTTLCFESLPGTARLRACVQRDRLASGSAAIAWHVGIEEREAAERQQGASVPVIASARPTLAILSLPWPVNGLGSMCALERSGIPELVRFHAARGDFEPSPLVLGVPADSVRRGHHRVGVSDSLSRRVEQIARAPSGAVSTIRNGASVPVPIARSAAHATTGSGPGARPSEMLILTVGRLSFEKGVREYPEVVERVLARELRCRFAYIGDGPARRWLGDELRTRGIAERVTLTGWLDDVLPNLAAADAFFLPSLFEGPAVAILEAAAAGLPIVCTDLPCTREALADGETALMCPVGDVAAYPQGLQRVVESPALRGSLSRRLARLAGEFSVEPMRDVFARVVQCLAGEPRLVEPA